MTFKFKILVAFKEFNIFGMGFKIPGPSKGCRSGSWCSTSQAPYLDCWFIGVDVGDNCGDVVCEGGPHLP